MTIEERLAFLLQSTESLHASTQELHASTQQLHDSMRELRATAAEHTKQLQVDAENIRSLVRIAEIHDARLSDLEGDHPA